MGGDVAVGAAAVDVWSYWSGRHWPLLESLCARSSETSRKKTWARAITSAEGAEEGLAGLFCRSLCLLALRY